MVLVLIPTSKNRSSRELRWTSSKAAVRSTEPLPSWAKIMAGHAGCHWESTISRWNQDWFKGKFTGKAPYFIGKSMKGFQIQTNQSIPRWNPQYWYSTSQPSPTLLLKWVVLTIKIWMLYYCFTKTLIIFELRCPRATMDFFPSLSIVPTLSMFVHRPTSHGKKGRASLESDTSFQRFHLQCSQVHPSPAYSFLIPSWWWPRIPFLHAETAAWVGSFRSKPQGPKMASATLLWQTQWFF